VLNSYVKLYDLLLTTQDKCIFLHFLFKFMHIGYVLHLPIYNFYAAKHYISHLLRYQLAVELGFLIFTFHPRL
jgi:hypothetical protein